MPAAVELGGDKGSLGTTLHFQASFHACHAFQGHGQLGTARAQSPRFSVESPVSSSSIEYGGQHLGCGLIKNSCWERAGSSLTRNQNLQQILFVENEQ